MSLHIFGRALPFSVAVLLSLFALSHLSAQDNPPAVDAGSAEIKADAAAPSQAAAKADIVVLEGEALSAIKAKKASDLLGQVAGVAVSDGGSGGGLTQVRIRGSTADQVVIIVDGRRLNDAMSGAPDLAMLSAALIERIEILRGGAATAYGADAVGGVIFITTKKNNVNGLDLQIENQSHFVQGNNLSLVDAQRLTLNARLGSKDVRFGLRGSFVNDIGLFSYKDAGGGDQVRKQVPTEFGSGGLDFAAPLGNGRFSAALEGKGSRTGVPGSTSWGLTPNDYSDDFATNLNLAWKTDSFISDALDFNARLIGSWHEYFVNSDAGAKDLYTVSLDIRQSALVSDWLTIDYGLDGGYQIAFMPGMLDSAGLAPHRLNGGLFLNPHLKFGAFTINPALRTDLFSDFPAGITASLGLDYVASDLVTLRLSGGRSYKTPTFNFLWWKGSGMTGNPNLKPESSWNADAGIVVSNKNFTSRSTGFVRYVLDGIYWGYNPSPSNTDYALYPGFDQDVSIQFDWFRAGVNYEFLHSYYLSGSNKLANDFRVANTPEHRFGFRIGGVWEHFELQLDGQVVGSAYGDNANGTLVAAYCVLNANASYHFDAKTEIYLAADNLLNASYQISDGYPMPGFALRLGLKAAF